MDDALSQQESLHREIEDIVKQTYAETKAIVDAESLATIEQGRAFARGWVMEKSCR